MNYHSAERNLRKNKELSNVQRKWIEMQKLFLKEKVDFASIKPPDNHIKKIVFNIVKSNYFDIIILICIIGNILTMAMSYEGSSLNYQSVFKNIFMLYLLYIS